MLTSFSFYLTEWMIDIVDCFSLPSATQLPPMIFPSNPIIPPTKMCGALIFSFILYEDALYCTLLLFLRRFFFCFLFIIFQLNFILGNIVLIIIKASIVRVFESPIKTSFCFLLFVLSLAFSWK